MSSKPYIRSIMWSVNGPNTINIYFLVKTVLLSTLDQYLPSFTYLTCPSKFNLHDSYISQCVQVTKLKACFKKTLIQYKTNQYLSYLQIVHRKWILMYNFELQLWDSSTRLDHTCVNQIIMSLLHHLCKFFYYHANVVWAGKAKVIKSSFKIHGH